jgi:hypothetical protein
MELNSAVGAGVSDLQHDARAEIDRILEDTKGDEIAKSKLLIARGWRSVFATAITSSDSGPAPVRCARSRPHGQPEGAVGSRIGLAAGLNHPPRTSAKTKASAPTDH